MICCNHVTSVPRAMVRKRITEEEIACEATVTGVIIIDGTRTIITNAALTTIAVPEVVLEDGDGIIAVTDSVIQKARGEG